MDIYNKSKYASCESTMDWNLKKIEDVQDQIFESKIKTYKDLQTKLKLIHDEQLISIIRDDIEKLKLPMSIKCKNYRVAKKTFKNERSLSNALSFLYANFIVLSATFTQNDDLYMFMEVIFTYIPFFLQVLEF